MQHKPHCLIVGGGFAGATAAVTLVQAGWRVTLLEAKSEAGGRVYSLTDRETGEVIDNGQHLLMGCYHHTLHVLQTLGTEGLLRPQKSMRVDFADCKPNTNINAEFFTLDTSLLPGKAGMALGIARLRGLTLQDRFNALLLSLKIQLHIARPQGKTAQEFLVEYKQSDNSIHRFWEPIILATLNAHPSAAAASLLVEVFRRAFFADTASSRLLLPRTGLAELLAPLPKWLERYGCVFRQATVSEILFESNRVIGAKTSSGEVFHADCMISTVPPRILARLLPESISHPIGSTWHFAQLTQYEFSPIVSVYLWFDRPCFEQEFIAMLGTKVQWIFNRRRMCDAPDDVVKRFPGHISLTISASDDIITASADTIITLCMDELRQAFPSVREAVLLRSRVIKEKMATPHITPELELKRLTAQTPIANFFVAGDWTDTKLPATIEGASQSGFTAAQMALRGFSSTGKIMSAI